MKQLLHSLFIIITVQSIFLDAMECVILAPQLPKEIIVHIAGWLQPRDKNTLMRVCKFFQVCVKDRELIVRTNPFTVSMYDKEEDMLLYAYEDNISMMEFLLKHGVSANLKNILGRTLFHMAIDNQSDEAMLLLIEHRANIRPPKPSLHALHEAAYQGDLEQVQKLIQSGTDPNLIIKKEGITPLIIAAYKGYIGIVEALIYEGAKADQAAENGRTPLYSAAERGHTDIVQLLFNTYANVNLATKNGYTPLHIAVDKGHIEIVQLLIDAEANVNLASNDGYTPLHIAAQKGYNDIAQLVINAQNVNQLTLSGWTPLCIAAYNGRINCVTVLLNNGADIHHAIKTKSPTDPLIKKSDTALQIAQKKGHIEVVKLLQEHLQREKENNPKKEKKENCTVQ